MKNVIYLFLIILFSPISVKGQEMLSPDSTICFIDSKEADYQLQQRKWEMVRLMELVKLYLFVMLS